LNTATFFDNLGANVLVETEAFEFLSYVETDITFRQDFDTMITKRISVNPALPNADIIEVTGSGMLLVRVVVELDKL